MSVQRREAGEDAIAILARHVAGLSYEALPKEAVAAAKLFILDTLAATIAGSGQPGIAEVVATLRGWGGRPESSVAIWGGRLPAHEAVIANVAMAHALEIDDAHYPAIVHPTAPTLWAALATAEALSGVPGRALLTAVAGGVDLMVRLALAAPRTLYLGYHTALFSGFGAAAAAGKLRGLDAAKLHDAFGITFSQAGATVQAATDGALVKRLQPAFNTSDGMKAVSLAERGITGIRRVLEGPFGLYRLFNHSGCDRGPLLEALGERFYGTELTIKRYPTSRCAHAPIEGAIHLVRQHNLEPADVCAVAVEVSEGCFNICGAPYRANGRLSQTSAQFSIPYTVAAAIKWRDVFVAEVQESAFADPEVAALAGRVTVTVASDLRGAMSFAPVRIRITTHAGDTYAHTVKALKGSPELPMSWDEVVEERLSRALRYSARPLADGTADELQRTVAALEDAPDAAVLAELLSGGGAGAQKPANLGGSKGRRQPAPRRAGSDAIAALAEHVAAVEYGDLDEVAREATKRLLLDATATTIAGASAPGCEAVAGLLREWGGREESSIVLHGGRVPSHHAVIANVMMCHALELDDLYDPAIAHATAPAFWSGMATAEALGRTSGRDLLTAVAVGADVMCRMAAAASRTFTLGHHNALLAGFAAVATAGKLRRVGAAVLQDAFGIVFCQAAASVQALPDGALVKRLQPALNACDGLRSLALAESGITGVQAVLEGKFGFCRLFSHDACDRDALLTDLGRRFLGAEASIKRYPSSRCTHAPVEAVLHLVRRHQLRAEDVAAVKVQVSGPCVRVAGAPFAETAGSVQVDAQFNIAYTVAAALLWGDVFVPQITEPLVLEPRARELAARVTVDVLPGMADRMTFVPVQVMVRLTSGQELTHRLERLKGSPQDPMDWDDIVAERLERCLAYSPRPIAAANVDRLVGLVKRLEESADVREIIALLS